MHTTISNIRLQLAYERNADAAMTNQFTGCGIVQTKKYGRTAQTLTQVSVVQVLAKVTSPDSQHSEEPSSFSKDLANISF